MSSGMREDLLDLHRVLQRGGDPGGAEPAGAQGEAEAPRRLDDGVEQAGPPAAVVAADDGRDDDGGTSARCSARYVADAITFSLGWPVPCSRSAAADMNGSAVSR